MLFRAAVVAAPPIAAVGRHADSATVAVLRRTRGLGGRSLANELDELRTSINRCRHLYSMWSDLQLDAEPTALHGSRSNFLPFLLTAAAVGIIGPGASRQPTIVLLGSMRLAPMCHLA